MKRITNGLNGQSSGLESNPRFRQAFERVMIPRVSTVGWVDCREIFNSTSVAMGPLGGLVKPLLMMIGADSLDHLIQASGVDKDAMIQRTFVATGGRTDGVMALAAGQPIQPRHFSHIPADADLVIATSISLTKIYREIRQLLVKAQPLSVVQPLSLKFFDEAVKQLEAELELKIADDILPAFDDVVTAFNSPAAGGLIATSLVVSLEVKNHQKATLVFDRLMKLAEQSLTSDQSDGYDASITFRHQQFLGHTIYYVNSTGASYGVSVSTTPSFCLTDRHLLFAIHPQAMKAQLRHLQSKQSGFDQHANRKVSLPAGDVLTYAYLNGPRANGIAGTILPYLGHTFLNRLEFEGISMDSFSIPSAAAIAPYFGDSTAAVTRQKDGLFVETRNAPPVIVSLALLSAYRAWNATDFEYLEVSRQRKTNGRKEARRDPAGNKIVPAVANTKEGARLAEKPNSSPYRKLAPLLLKAMLPDDIQQLIPESAYRKLEEGTSATTIQRQKDARRKREELRKKHLEKTP